MGDHKGTPLQAASFTENPEELHKSRGKMEKTAVITFEIDEELKQQVEAILAKQGKTIEQEIEWLIHYIVTHKRLPFDIEQNFEYS